MFFEVKGICYYQQLYETDKEILDMCKSISIYLDKQSYGNMVEQFDLNPVVAPQEILDQGLWEEEVSYPKLIKKVYVFKHIDYLKYMDGNVEMRKKLMVRCILEAGLMVKKKRGTKFNYKKFEKDILYVTGYDIKDLFDE